MRSWTKKLFLGAISTIVSVGIIVLPFLIFIKPNNKFIFGNFQSYISDDVKAEMREKYDINRQYYGSNEEIPTFIQNGTMDIAVATNDMIAKLVIEDRIEPIPWGEFNITKSDGTKVNSYKDLQGFVTDAVWQIGQEFAEAINLKDPDNPDQVGNLLEYCVPYFMQTFTFAYRGPEIPASEIGTDPSYADIFNYISKSDYFNSKPSAVMMIDDSARSIYDVGRIVGGETNINPSVGRLTMDGVSSTAVSVNEASKTFDNISNYYKTGTNTITFNEDPSIILNKIALNQSYGAFLYNGDSIYAAMGGDNPEGTPNLPNFDGEPDFHVIVPTMNFFAMDGLVINKKMNPAKKEKAINIIKDLCLSGLNYGENVSETDADGNYVYLATENFGYVNYTPCYEGLYEYATSKDSDGYFPSIYDNQNLIDTLVKLISINADNISQNNIELPLNDVSNSNISLAYLEFKNNL